MTYILNQCCETCLVLQVSAAVMEAREAGCFKEPAVPCVCCVRSIAVNSLKCATPDKANART